MIKGFLRKTGILPEKLKNPVVSNGQEQTPSSVKEQTASKTVRVLDKKENNKQSLEKTPKNKVQVLGKKIYADKSTVLSPVYDGQVVSVRFPIPSVDEGISVMGLQNDKPEHKIRNESSYREGVRIILAHILGKEFHLEWEPTLEDIVRGDFNQSVKSKKGASSKKIILILNKNGGYIEIIDIVQVLAKKIYDERKEIHSTVQSERIVNVQFRIPSINDGALIGFQGTSNYISVIPKIIRDILKKKLNIRLSPEENILDGHFEKSIKSEGGLLDRKVIVKFQDDGGYIGVSGRDAIGGRIPDQPSNHIDPGSFCKKGDVIWEVKKIGDKTDKTDEVDGIDVYGERIHRYVECGKGIHVEETYGKVTYTANTSGILIMEKGANRIGMSIPKHMSINKDYIVGSEKELIPQFGGKGIRKDQIVVGNRKNPLGINLEIETENVGRNTSIVVEGNIACATTNCHSLVSTEGQILVSRALQGGNTRGPFVSLKNASISPSTTGNNIISANVLELYNVTFKGSLTINIGRGQINESKEGWFEEKFRLTKEVIDTNKIIKEEEKEFKELLLKMINQLEQECLGESAQVELSLKQKEWLNFNLRLVKGYLLPLNIQVIYDIFEKKLYQKHNDFKFMYKYLRQYSKLFKIYESHKENEAKKQKNEDAIEGINEKLATSLYIHITGLISERDFKNITIKRTSFKIIETEGKSGKPEDKTISIKSEDKSIPITEEESEWVDKDRRVAMCLKYDLETDEFIKIPEDVMKRELERIKKELPGVSG